MALFRIVSKNRRAFQWLKSFNLSSQFEFPNAALLERKAEINSVSINYASLVSQSFNVDKQFKRKASSTDELNELVSSHKAVSASKWKELQDTTVSKKSSTSIFHNRVLTLCLQHQNFPAAKSFVRFVESSGDSLNLVALSLYVRICSLSLDFAGEDEIFKYYGQLRDAKHTDFKVLNNVIFALAATTKWKECLGLIENNRRLFDRASLATFYSLFCSAALRSNDVDAFVEVLSKMQKSDFALTNDICFEWLSYCENIRSKSEEKGKMAILRMLQFFREHSQVLPVCVTDRIQGFYERLTQDEWQANYVNIPESGLCPNCNENLESSSLANEDFKVLQHHFVTAICTGTDAQLRVPSDELERFKEFLKAAYPIKFVIDGSLAFHNIPKDSTIVKIKQFNSVVVPLIDKFKKNIVIIAPKTMEFWTEYEYDYLRRKCYIFFTSIKTDPLLLLATLYGGQHARVITRDLLYTYKYTCLDNNIAFSLKSWLLSHQIAFERSTFSGEIDLMSPVFHNTSVQFPGATIHIPGTRKPNPVTNKMMPDHWMCLKNLNNKQLTTILRLE